MAQAAGKVPTPSRIEPPMLPISATTLSRPSWQINLLALVLVLATSAGLLWILGDGPPSRAETAFLLAALLLTPVAIRWQAGWIVLFLALPWVAWVRRMALYFDPKAAAREAFDLTLLLPDVTVAIAFSGFMLTRHLRRREVPDPAEKPLHVALNAFTALCALQIFNPIMASVGAGINGWRVFVLYLALYWITRVVGLSARAVTAWVVLGMTFGGLTGLYGAYQYLVGFPAHEVAWAEATQASSQVIGESMRAFSTFSFTSTFSHYMVIAACICAVAARLDGVGRLGRMLAPFALGLCLVGLAVTFVRSSFLGLILAGAVGLVVAGSPRRRVLRLVGVLTIGAAAILLSPSSVGDAQAFETPSTGTLVADRLLSMRDPRGVGSFATRLVMWQRTVSQATTTYPMGVGVGAGQASRFGGSGFAAAYAYSESQFFSILAELGWPGFVLFLWISGYGLVFTLRTYDELASPERKRLALLAIVIQVGILTTGITGGPILYTIPGSAYYWTALGLAAALRRAERAERGELYAAAAGPYDVGVKAA